jgi:hypothetical protein
MFWPPTHSLLVLSIHKAEIFEQTLMLKAFMNTIVAHWICRLTRKDFTRLERKYLDTCHHNQNLSRVFRMA